MTHFYFSIYPIILDSVLLSAYVLVPCNKRFTSYFTMEIMMMLYRGSVIITT